MTNTKCPPISHIKKSTKLVEKTNQHSGYFYISNSLFNNKRLKQKRFKWAACKRDWTSRARQKTELLKHRYAALKADVTIDLLSDDDENKVAEPTVYPTQLIMYPTIVGGNLTFIPAQQISINALQSRINCKRKSKAPKRHTQPVIVNTESIVLSDSEGDFNEHYQETEVASTSYLSAQKTELASNGPCISQVTQAPPTNGPYITQVAQVEEVTVSLVPRSSGGSCGKTSTSQLFPMVPDETTVHTIIANRIYELPLNKLREGLVTNDTDSNNVDGDTGFSNGNASDAASPQQTPIALKLSSDLSISLISDDEDNECDMQPSAQKLMEQQPHLSVQQLPMPMLKSRDSRHVPKRKILS